MRLASSSRLQHRREDLRILLPELAGGGDHRKRGGPAITSSEDRNRANARILSLTLMERRRAEVRANAGPIPKATPLPHRDAPIEMVNLSKRVAWDGPYFCRAYICMMIAGIDTLIDVTAILS